MKWEANSSIQNEYLSSQLKMTQQHYIMVQYSILVQISLGIDIEG